MFKFIRLSLFIFLVSCGTSKDVSEEKNTNPEPPTPEPKIEKVYATVDDNGYLIGVANKEHFLQEPFITWFSDDFDNYFPDPVVIEEIKPLLDGITIKAFMGTWCGDSRREVPHFYKILTDAGFDFDKLTMVAVDREKTSPRHEEEGLKIYYVPTFIFYKDGVEINRFIEYPQDSLERDILSILKEEGYKNSYYEG
ncbi:MAG: thiol reductase thioredoxin [Flavobacteriia bacterium]|nr:MAG: thiol reductase thioredoxin [Flavobacteriia bacterium]